MTSIKSALLSAKKLQTLDLPNKISLVGPILHPSITFLHAPTGIGKTLFSLEMAISIVSGNTQFKTNTGEEPNWEVDKQGAVLIVDGEMSLGDLRNRLDTQSQNRNTENLHFLSNVEYGKHTNELLNITKPSMQDEIEELLKELNIVCVVFDNLSTLCGTRFDENSAKDQKGLNHWFASLREQEISVIFIHHDNKSGQQRGSSDRETVVDLTMHLTRPELANADQAIFDIDYEKARSRLVKIIPFTAKFAIDRWRFMTRQQSSMDALLNHMELTNEWSWRDIADELGLKKSRIYQLRSLARDLGEWNDKWDTKRSAKKG